MAITSQLAMHFRLDYRVAGVFGRTPANTDLSGRATDIGCGDLHDGRAAPDRYRPIDVHCAALHHNYFATHPNTRFDRAGPKQVPIQRDDYAHPRTNGKLSARR